MLLHTHDLELDVVRSDVIYLYRDPVDTVYSQLRYHREDSTNGARIAYWSDLYGRHLDKWLHEESFTERKTVVTYEGLKADIVGEFSKLCKHFGVTLDAERLQVVAEHVTKKRVKEKTDHDEQVVDLAEDHNVRRSRFRVDQSDYVWEALLNGREHLRQNF
jgi:hypothetical protein